MPDNIPITAGTGTTVATDELTINATPVHVQRSKIVAGKDGTYVGDVSGRTVDGDSNASALFVDARPLAATLSATPVVSTAPAYSNKDAVGGLLTFAGAARAAGGVCRIQAVQVLDKGQQMGNLDLVLFDRSVTAPTDNAVFDPTDTELGYIRGVIPIGGWSDFNDNSIAVVNNVGLDIALNGSDLYGALVMRPGIAVTYASVGDLTVTLQILKL